MAYASWSVSFGEQPSAAKWNILGTNDASFNDGTGIGTNAIAAASLATNAIKLGYTAITSNFSTTSTTGVQVTGLTVTVTIPAGGRSIKITVYSPSLSASVGNTAMNLNLWDGTVGSGTNLQSWSAYFSASNDQSSLNMVSIQTPAAGSKTYNVGMSVSGGTGTLSANATNPAFILVEAI